MPCLSSHIKLSTHCPHIDGTKLFGVYLLHCPRIDGTRLLGVYLPHCPHIDGTKLLGVYLPHCPHIDATKLFRVCSWCPSPRCTGSLESPGPSFSWVTRSYARPSQGKDKLHSDSLLNSKATDTDFKKISPSIRILEKKKNIESIIENHTYQYIQLFFYGLNLS